MSKTIAIYHKDCTDGTTAGAVLLKKFPEALVFPLSHGFEPHELEPILSQAEAGDSIFTVDCVMGVKEFLAKGFSVTSIDHHAGVKEEMEQLAKENPRFTFIFDNSKSGASLSWTYFFPKKPMPEIIKYVEDMDIWTWKYGNTTRDVGNYLCFLTNKPEETLKLFDGPLDEIKKGGETISKYTNYVVDMTVEKTEPIYLKIGEYRVPFYNVTLATLKSEIGNKFAILRKEAVGIFSIDGHKVKISFRSLDGHKPSALELAKILQGGGHVNASGAGMNLDDFTQAIVK